MTSFFTCYFKIHFCNTLARTINGIQGHAADMRVNNKEA